jgi:hypothetical protein
LNRQHEAEGVYGSKSSGNEAITAAIGELVGGDDFEGVIELLQEALGLPAGFLRNLALEAARSHLELRNPQGPAGNAMPFVREALGLIR